MKLSVGILGYGNLGKSLEKNLQNNADFELKGIFSRRNLDNSLFVPVKNLTEFRGKLEILLVALGSHNDIAQNIAAFAPFDTVDSFDTHAEMEKYRQLLKKHKTQTISVYAAGWDPGVLSLARGIFSLGGGNTATFWGKGISQGHSNALRSIKGVLDAVEITLPQSPQNANLPEHLRHKRLCYVACVERDKPRVEAEILNMPNYFCHQQVEIHYCTVAEVQRLKKDTSHAGKIYTQGDGFSATVQLNVQNNTDYTAKIMLAYAKAIPQLKRDGYLGALNPFDIPLKYLTKNTLL